MNGLDRNIPITIELGSLLSELAYAEGVSAFRHRLTIDLRALLKRFGLVGEPEVKLQNGYSGRAVRIRVHGVLQPYAPDLLKSVWLAIAPLDLLNWPDMGPPGRSTGFPDAWLTSYLPVSYSLMFDYLERLVLEVIQERLSCLINLELATAFISDGVAASVDISMLPSPEALLSMLKSLFDLGVSIVDKSLVLRQFCTSRPVDDRVEMAFARLRSNRVEIHAHAEFFKRLLHTKIDEPLSASVEQLNEHFQEQLLQIEDEFFSKLGIVLPGLVLVPSPQMGNMEVKINDRLKPLMLAEETQLNEVFTILYNALAQSADQLLSIEDVEYQLAQLNETHPTLVQAALTCFSIGDITRVLRGLVKEGISIRDLRTILERLLRYDTIPFNSRKDKINYKIFDDRLAVPMETSPKLASNWPYQLEFVRSGLKHYLSHKYTGDQNLLSFYQLDQAWEIRVEDMAVNANSDLDEADYQSLLDAVWAQVELVGKTSPGSVILTTACARATLRGLLAPELPDLPIVAHTELRPGIDKQPIGMIR